MSAVEESEGVDGKSHVKALLQTRNEVLSHVLVSTEQPPAEAAGGSPSGVRPIVRMLLISDAVPGALDLLFKAAREDVLCVLHPSSAVAEDAVATALDHLARAAPRHAAFNVGKSSPLLESITLWHPFHGDSNEAALAHTAALVAGLEHVLQPSGRVHVLTPKLLPPKGHNALDKVGPEAQVIRQLTEAAGGRFVAVGRAEPLRHEPYLCLSASGECVDVTHLLWHHHDLSAWQFSRDVLGGQVIDTHDREDMKATILTVIMEVPFLYATMVASFLVIFVQEPCDEFVSSCSAHENLGLKTRLGKLTFSFNVLSAFFIVLGDVFLKWRERYLINFLDVDTNCAETHLPTVINSYPAIKSALRTHNFRSSRVSMVACLVVIINFIVSACHLLRGLGQHKVCCPGTISPAVKTVITLITSVALIFVKLVQHVLFTQRSFKEDMGISTVQKRPLSFNVIDSMHVADCVQNEVEAEAVKALKLARRSRGSRSMSRSDDSQVGSPEKGGINIVDSL